MLTPSLPEMIVRIVIRAQDKEAEGDTETAAVLWLTARQWQRDLDSNDDCANQRVFMESAPERGAVVGVASQ